MSNADQVLVVGSIDCNDQVNTFLVSFFLGKPLRVAAEYGGPTFDVASVGSIDTSALVESRFFVQVKGSSVDDVSARVAEIAEQLRDLNAITMGLKGSDHTGILVPKIAECVEIPQEAPWDSRLVNQNSTMVELIVRRNPYVYVSPETVHSAAAVTLPSVASMAAQTGDAPAPWGILFDFAALECRTLFAGRYPDETAAIADFARELVGATWVDTSGTGAAASDDAGYGTAIGGNELWGTEGVCYTDLDVTDFEPGEYLVVVKAKSADGTDPGTIHTPYCDPVSITTTALALYPLGVVTLPTSAVRGAETAKLRLTLTGKGAGDSVYANAVFFIPTSFGGLVGWRRPAGHAHEVRFESEMVYADDVVALSEAFGGRQIRGLGGVLVAVAEQATPAAGTAVALTVAATPRYEQLPSGA